LSQVTSQEFLKELTKVTSVVKPKRTKKPKEAAKYKRITVEQFNSYQQWLDSEAGNHVNFIPLRWALKSTLMTILSLMTILVEGRRVEKHQI
jgi:hypothetical protein